MYDVIRLGTNLRAVLPNEHSPGNGTVVPLLGSTLKPESHLAQDYRNGNSYLQEKFYSIVCQFRWIIRDTIERIDFRKRTLKGLSSGGGLQCTRLALDVKVGVVLVSLLFYLKLGSKIS